jgi:NADH:ubiquinone oxidoreductase subunit E
LRFTFKQVHCLGCCALAPVVKVDDAYYGNPSMKELKRIFASCADDAPVEGEN